MAQEELEDGWGSIDVRSTPSDAAIILDEKLTGKRTPALLENIQAGIHTLAIELEDHQFIQKNIIVIADSTLTLSFELLSSMDTLYIHGQESALGIVRLSPTPTMSPYLLNRRPVAAGDIPVSEGRHWIYWDGRDRYSSLDTTVEIHAGGVIEVPFVPRRLAGRLTVTVLPDDALIFIDSLHQGQGRISSQLPTGPYTAHLHRPGYYDLRIECMVHPHRETVRAIELQKVPDEDGDGFLDDDDPCPRTYGIYGGCPKPSLKTTLKASLNSVWENMRNDPLVFSLDGISLVHRRPVNRTFNEFISYFNNGRTYFNNFSGLHLCNAFSVSFHGFSARIHLGQWNNGLEYRKHDTLYLAGTQAVYAIHSDAFDETFPTVFIKSTSISGGVHFRVHHFDAVWHFGYQWEDIHITGLHNMTTGRHEMAGIDNDFFFNRLEGALLIPVDDRFGLQTYAALSLSTGARHCDWMGLEAGSRISLKTRQRRTASPRNHQVDTLKSRK